MDLFGQVPVSTRDVALWLWKVPVWRTRHSPQRKLDSYVRGYNVVDKITAAKLSGRLGEILGDERCDHCGAMLETDQTGQIEALQQELAALMARPKAPVLRLITTAVDPQNLAIARFTAYFLSNRSADKTAR